MGLANTSNSRNDSLLDDDHHAQHSQRLLGFRREVQFVVDVVEKLVRSKEAARSRVSQKARRAVPLDFDSREPIAQQERATAVQRLT